MKTEKEAKIEELRKRFPFIVKWGHRMGSFPYYVDVQLERAEASNAPANATFQNHETGKWNTTDDITNESLRAEWGLPEL